MPRGASTHHPKPDSSVHQSKRARSGTSRRSKLETEDSAALTSGMVTDENQTGDGHTDSRRKPRIPLPGYESFAGHSGRAQSSGIQEHTMEADPDVPYAETVPDNVFIKAEPGTEVERWPSMQGGYRDDTPTEAGPGTQYEMEPLMDGGYRDPNTGLFYGPRGELRVDPEQRHPDSDLYSLPKWTGSRNPLHSASTEAGPGIQYETAPLMGGWYRDPETGLCYGREHGELKEDPELEGRQPDLYSLPQWTGQRPSKRGSRSTAGPSNFSSRAGSKRFSTAMSAMMTKDTGTSSSYANAQQAADGPEIRKIHFTTDVRDPQLPACQLNFMLCRENTTNNLALAIYGVGTAGGKRWQTFRKGFIKQLGSLCQTLSRPIVGNPVALAQSIPPAAWGSGLMAAEYTSLLLVYMNPAGRAYLERGPSVSIENLYIQDLQALVVVLEAL